MTSFREFLADGWRRTAAVRWLLVVPFGWSLVQFDAVRRVLANPGFHLGVAFPTPSPLPTLWAFTSVPTRGVTVETPLVVGGGPLAAAAGIALTVLVGGALAAGFLGALHAALTGADRGGFVVNVVRFGVRQTLYAGVVTLAGLLAVGATALSSPFVVVAVVGGFVAVYLFYATPFLVVTEGRSLAGAFRRSYRLAVGGGDYAAFFLWYLVAGALVSVPVTVLAVNLGVAGIVVGAAACAPACLAFTAATLLFLDGLDDPSPAGDESPVWSDRTDGTDAPAGR